MSTSSLSLIIKILTRKKSNVKLAILFFACLGIWQCQSPQQTYPEGVTVKLAVHRDSTIKDVTYSLHYNIPNAIDSIITASVKIKFKNTDKRTILDFRAPQQHLVAVKDSLGNEIPYQFINGHIYISGHPGSSHNFLEIDFIPTETGINRNKEYLYTLFVPDRASTAFPCFDQPDIKARFQLSLTTPVEWVAVSNSPMLSTQKYKAHKNYKFALSKPISTYLFSFVAGKFEVVKRTHKNRQIRFYHRQKDQALIAQNIDKIFELQYAAIDWMESFTTVPHPFNKLDIIAIPSFQYSGMEHPGAILYRSEKLFLAKQAPIRQEMARANLISHETAHLWFGDLVTMNWFNEVWLKEVFANFLADKIVEENFAKIDHNLNFYLNHFAQAFSVDRTQGATPIQQPLNNLLNAGSLYGPIIYHKSPIVMKQLENIVGKETLKSGLQTYVKKFSYKNAGWQDLIEILAPKFNGDLYDWSQTWVFKAGRPHVSIYPAFNEEQQITSLIIKNIHPTDTQSVWQQPLSIKLGINKNSSNDLEFLLLDTLQVEQLVPPQENLSFLLPGANGLAYAHFNLDKPELIQLVTKMDRFQTPLHRAIAYQIAWEHMLDAKLNPKELKNYYYKSLKQEKNKQLEEWLLAHIEQLYVEYLDVTHSDDSQQEIASFLWKKAFHKASSNRLSYLHAYTAIATNAEQLNRLLQAYISKPEDILPKMNTTQRMDLALQLMLKLPEQYDSILMFTKFSITDEEHIEQFNMLAQSVHPDKSIRDSLFASFSKVKNREKEPWVASAMYWLNHPINKKESISYIRPALNLLTDIQHTGDIFFPKQWLNNLFWGHNTQKAIDITETFLLDNEDYPKHLQNKILQALDKPKRKVTIAHTYN